MPTKFCAISIVILLVVTAIDNIIVGMSLTINKKLLFFCFGEGVLKPLFILSIVWRVQDFERKRKPSPRCLSKVCDLIFFFFSASGL